jgi:hypothetical protein
MKMQDDVSLGGTAKADSERQSPIAATRTLYVVTSGSGSYSDYGISAIFDSRELAETAMADGCGDSIEEYPLNPGVDQYHAGRSLFVVEMRRDGSVVRTESLGWAWAGDRPDPLRLTVEWGDTSYDYRRPPIAIILRAETWSKDTEQAIKAVNEQRAQWIATGKWAEAEAEMRATWRGPLPDADVQAAGAPTVATPNGQTKSGHR